MPLLEKAATTLQILKARCILLSFKPFPIAKLRLWPKQLNLLQFKSSHANLTLAPLSVVIPTSLAASNFHNSSVSVRTSLILVALWSWGK